MAREHIAILAITEDAVLIKLLSHLRNVHFSSPLPDFEGSEEEFLLLG